MGEHVLRPHGHVRLVSRSLRACACVCARLRGCIEVYEVYEINVKLDSADWKRTVAQCLVFLTGESINVQRSCRALDDGYLVECLLFVVFF